MTVGREEEAEMGWSYAAILHLLLVGMFGGLVVATIIPIYLLALVTWVLVVRWWARRWGRTHPGRWVNAVAAVQVVGMVAIVWAPSAAPGKVVDRFKAQTIILPKQAMTLDELANPVEHGWSRYFYGSMSVPDGLADRVVRFPARELTIGRFIEAVETQAPLWHRFGHCGNGSTVLWGGDCSFGLQFYPRPSATRDRAPRTGDLTANAS
jgi:hypothetical protein